MIHWKRVLPIQVLARIKDKDFLEEGAPNTSISKN